jgi:hypothetical protein
VGKSALVPERLLAVESALLERLVAAIGIGDGDGAAEAAAAIGSQDAELGTELGRAIKAFRYEELIELFDRLDSETSRGTQ